jgi:hypothetical protein
MPSKNIGNTKPDKLYFFGQDGVVPMDVEGNKHYVE